jgi:Zn-finger nucleic acid-binding protein
MHSLERNGITIERCAECRGVFLDRGELDRLIDAESRPPALTGQGRTYDDERRYDNERSHDHGHRKKKRGFLSDFFDD